MAKGVTYSLTFVFLVSLLIIASVLLFRTSLSTEERATEFSLMNRLYDLDQSLQNIVRQTLASTTTFSTLSNNRSLSIIQDFPDTSFTNFTTSLTNLKNFVEADDQNIKFNLVNLDTRSVQIIPYIMNYTKTNTTITITPFPTTATGIILDFTLPISTISWDQFSAGTFPMTIITENNSAKQTSTQNIDLTQAFQASITANGNTIQIKNGNQALTITNNLNLTVRSNTTLSFAHGNTKPLLFLPNLYTITFSDFNTTKQSGVQLTSLT